jgi:PKD repeat protein
VGTRGGSRSIDQICSIYDYLVDEKNWTYVEDWTGTDQYQYSNKTLEYGEKSGILGKGDCDDFAILLAALIESVGGTPRIVFSYRKDGGHAYTEVFLGKDRGPGSDVDRMINYLQKNYNINEIYAHNDTGNQEVWLNLDWWKEPGGATHPGGPFFKGDYNITVYPENSEPSLPLTPPNEPPTAMFYISKLTPNEGENITFNASESRDLGGRIDKYLWNFDDGTQPAEGKIVYHSFSKGNKAYKVSLTVTDNENTKGDFTQNIEVNELPNPVISYEPKKPKVEEKINFSASQSWDEDGEITRWAWEFWDTEERGESTKENPKSRIYNEYGNYTVNLTVFDDKGAKNTTSIKIKINEPPKAIFTYSPTYPLRYPNAGDPITFDASESKDLDGNITTYGWYFDGIPKNENKAGVTHSFPKGGNFSASLAVKDNNNSTSINNRTIRINWIPVAKISCSSTEAEENERIIFNASQSSDGEGGRLNYSWDFDNDGDPDSGLKKAPYQYLLDGEYRAKLTVTDENGASNSTSINISIKPANDLPKVESLNPDKPSPQEVGVAIRWIAEATDPESDQVLYSFLVNGQQTQNWSPENYGTWYTAGLAPGNYRVDVQVRDNEHESPGTHGSFDNIISRFTIKDDPDKQGNYWGSYLLNDSYFAGYIDGLLYEKSTDKNLNGCKSEVLKNEMEDRNITTNAPLDLSEGYKLSIRGIDLDGNKVYLELTKDGAVVDSKVISPFKAYPTVADKTYYYKKEGGDSNNLVVIGVHFKSFYHDSDQDQATIDAIWQISETPTCITMFLPVLMNMTYLWNATMPA